MVYRINFKNQDFDFEKAPGLNDRKLHHIVNIWQLTTFSYESFLFAKNQILKHDRYNAHIPSFAEETVHQESFENTNDSQRFIVQLKNGVTADDIRENGINGLKVSIISEFNSINALLVEFSEDFDVDAPLEDNQVESVIEDEFIQWIPPGETLKSAVDEAMYDEYYYVLNGLQRIGAYKVDSTKKIHATVAIIDTGIDTNNKKLNVIKEIDFCNEGRLQNDDNGHGTHVAGIVAATHSEKSSIGGVAPGANLVALKVLDEMGSGWKSEIIAAINWVTNHSDEIDVVNMSLGGKGTLNDIYHEAIKKSVVVQAWPHHMWLESLLVILTKIVTAYFQVDLKMQKQCIKSDKHSSTILNHKKIGIILVIHRIQINTTKA